MENQKKLLQFVEWLGANVPELKGQTSEQIVSTINKLSESPEGQEMLQGLIKEFESSMTGMFKKGGKLNYLICLKKGGSIKDCGCGDKINKKQPGGSITRKAAMDAATDKMGMNKSQARLAYQNQKNALRNAGYSGSELRQAARRNMIKSAYQNNISNINIGLTPYNSEITPVSKVSKLQTVPKLSDNIVVEDTPIEVNDDLFQNLDSSVPTIGLRGDFNSAFAQARKRGLSSFSWDNPNAKYDRYSTKLKPATGTAAGTAAGTATGMTATPTYIASPVDNGKGGKKYTWRDLFRMANVNGAVNMK